MNALSFVGPLLSSLIGPPQITENVQFVAAQVGQPVTICLDGMTIENSFAGRLSFRDQRHSWSSYCCDVRAPIKAGQFFTIRTMSSAAGQANLRHAGNIVAKYFRVAQTPDECAAVQLAVWEAIEDNGAVADFSSGAFAAQASEHVLALARQAYQAGPESGDVLAFQAAPGGSQTGGAGGSGGGQSQLGG